MKIITKQSAPRWLKQQLGKNNCQITLLSFKKDRQLIITLEDQILTIVEDGFQQATYSDLSLTAGLQLAKKLIAYEFPRSHNLYYQVKK